LLICLNIFFFNGVKAIVANLGSVVATKRLTPVPDKRSRVLEVVVVSRIINLGTGNLEWGGNGKGLSKGRSVYE
jgi:hypothetical protein